MHDVIRDFALAIAPKYNHIYMVKAGVDLQEWPSRDTFEDVTSISLMENNIRKLPDGLECPNLQVLLLQNNNSMVVPNNSFLGMKDLKVLDLSKTQLWKMPDSLSLLANLRTLNLSYCQLVDLAVIGKLSKLEILNLSNSLSIVEIPTSFGQLSYLRLLDLNNCRKLTIIPHGVISRLGKLEEFYMKDSSIQWDSEGGGSRCTAKLAEFQSLSRLTSLQICFPNPDLLPNNMPFQNLSNFVLIIGGTRDIEDFPWDTSQCSRNMCFSVTRIPKSLGWVNKLLERTENLFTEFTNSENILHGLTYNHLERLTINYDSYLVKIFHGESPTQSFKKLKFIEVIDCNSLLNIVPSNLLQRLQNLEHVLVNDCNSLVNIFDCEELEIANGETKMLWSLKYIYLRRLTEMSHVWKGEHQSISLHNLKKVYILTCPKLIKLFSPALLQSLICLEEIHIRWCYNLEEIFEKREAEDQEKGKKLDHIITSPSLGNLTCVIIQNCYELKNLFNSSIAKSLVKLRKLDLFQCSTIQEIVTDEEGASLESIVFPSLYHIELKDLSSLTCFSSGLFTMEFPALEDIKIYKCPKMKTFGYRDQLTPKLNKVEGHWNGNLNATVEQIFNEQRKKDELLAVKELGISYKGF